MIIRLYVDEDAQDRDLVRSLLARGVDVVTASDAGMVERPDEEHLDYATASGRTLFSFNVSDFYRLHTEYVARGKSHGGIILTQQQRYSVGEQMRRILKLIATKPAEEMVNQIEFLGVWG